MGFGHEERIAAGATAGKPPLPGREGGGGSAEGGRNSESVEVSLRSPTHPWPLPSREGNCYSSSLPEVSGSQNNVTTSAIATTPIVYQRPAKGSPVLATMYWLMKGRNPPK